MKVLWAAVFWGVLGVSAWGQFDLEESHTTSSLRGIDAVGPGVAWASGANGTVLRTEDGGILWQTCNVPKGAEKLDFRGIQAFDANTAVVMASGKGALSRIYKTTDACQSWKLVFENPDEDGFFDDLRRVTTKQMYLLGDPVNGKFAMFFSADQGSTWFIADDPGLDAAKGAGAFAASNSGLLALGNTLYFGAGGGSSAQVYATFPKCAPGASRDAACPLAWAAADVPMASGSASAGVFSLAGRTSASLSGKLTSVLTAVGGDYEKPDAASGTAAWSRDGGQHWTGAQTPPSGYRSAVVFDSAAQAWLAVGPNGTDVSTDDGKNWRPLKPGANEPAGADTGWNALSLPFVVGSKGRIGKLRDGVLRK
jgi:photosystem II stability/assembly factor-like uncharacterized protein